MKITKFEQSGFIIEGSSGYRIAIDIACKTPIEKLVGITVDAVLISHIHGDHFSSEHIGTIIPMHYEKNSNIDPIKCDEFVAEASKFYSAQVDPSV